jgi:TonB family protein
LAITTGVLVVGMLGVSSASQPASGKPVVYNLMAAPGHAVSQLFHTVYEPRFEIVDLADDAATYVAPELVFGRLPIATMDADTEIAGEVSVLFVVTAAGAVVNPVIYSSSDPRLSAAVLAALTGWLFAPARVNGQTVACTAVQRFVFYPIAVGSGGPPDRTGPREAAVP